jgi:uncharacterized membrane protein YgcG
MFIQRLIVTITVVETTTITITQTGEFHEDDTIDLTDHPDGPRVDDGGLRWQRDGSAGSAARDGGSAGSASSGSAGGGTASGGGA